MSSSSQLSLLVNGREFMNGCEHKSIFMNVSIFMNGHESPYTHSTIEHYHIDSTIEHYHIDHDSYKSKYTTSMSSKCCHLTQ
jgi:hypothetical protein